MSEQDQSLTDAEKIRLKRLARLATTTIQSPPNAEFAEPAVESMPTPSSRPPPSASSRLLSSLGESSSRKADADGKALDSKSSAATISSSTLGKRRSSPIRNPRPKDDSPAPKPPPNAPVLVTPKVSYQQWESGAMVIVFSATLSKDEAQGSDWRLCWLKGLQKELEEENISDPSLVPTSDMADRILIARLSLDPSGMASSDNPDILTILAGLPQDETIFEYLTGCWKRLYVVNRDAGRLAYSVEEKAKWQWVFEHIKSLIVSYCGMTLEDPDMFPQPTSRATGPAEFLPILLSMTPTSDPSNGDPFTASASSVEAATLPLSSADLLPFLSDLAAGTADVLPDVLTPTLSLFFQQWFQIEPTPDILGNDWRRYLGAVGTLVQIKAIAASLPSLNVWVAPEITAAKLEWQSLLGPLSRLSVFPREYPEVWKTYFSNPTERKTDDIEANKSNLRHTLGALQTSLFNIFNAIVRASPEAREGVLGFFALVVRLNVKRAGMRVDTRAVSSDGFMTNLLIVVLKLFEPVMDVSYSKIDKIDPSYYRNSSRINIAEETRIRATKEETDLYEQEVEAGAQPPTNFISDLFFLINAIQHFGVVKTIGSRIRAEKNISEVEKELKHTEASRGEWEGNANLSAQGEAAIKKLKSDIAILHASIHAYDTQLLDPSFVRLNVTFTSFLMTWLVRLVDPAHHHPHVSISLPLITPAAMDFRVLPEYLIENVTEYLDFLSRYNPNALETADKDILITFAITFLSPGYINNPFLKAKLVSILANGLYPMGHYRKGTLYDQLAVHSHSTQNLMPTIIRFFIDVETTGGHTQFWDKFNFRRDMSRIIRSMWDNPLHREAFIKARHDDFDQFIKFINMVMSDMTFHLEESLTNLAKINSIQSQQADHISWTAMPDNERQDQEAQLRQAESQAPFHTVMGLDHVELMRNFTATTREPFVTSEIVDRLVATLDENLTVLVGPRMQELRVSDPDRLSFKPKRLLAGIAQIYINLSQESDFIRAVANDGRSYSKELFERFARILKHRGIMTEGEVSEIIAFAQKVEDMKATISIEDERDIPDEFLDPLLSTLMKDPVILPMSRVVIDRATIRTVLLSKEVDPFNNMPLKFEDCIPDSELKAKIEAWVAEGNNKQASSVMDVDML